MPKALTPSSASQREQAYKSLRRLLILQQIEPGQRMREPEWAKRLGVHRSALREAFARLEAEGLIERGTQTGYFVPNLNSQDIEEITKLRVAFESLAIDEICAQPKADLETLTEACDQFETFFKGDYSLGTVEADRRFHEALINAAGMRRLTALYLRAPLPLIHGHTEDQHVWHDECGRTLSEHRTILNALAKGDADKAKLVLRSHLMQRSLLPMCR